MIALSQKDTVVGIGFDLAAIDLIQIEHRSHGVPVIVPSVGPAGRCDVYIYTDGTITQRNDVFGRGAFRYGKKLVVKALNDRELGLNFFAVDNPIVEWPFRIGPTYKWNLVVGAVLIDGGDERAAFGG